MTEHDRGLVKNRSAAVFEASDTQIHQLAEIARVNLEGTDEVLAALGAEELGRAEFSAIRAGAYFLQLKRQSGHSAFLPALEAVGVSPDRAQRAMQIARYIAALPAHEAKRIATLPRTKILPLVNADHQIVGELLESGALDGDEPLSLRELQQELRKTKRSLQKTQDDLELTQMERKALEREALQRHEGLDLPMWAAAARSEAVYQGEAFTAALDLLEDAYQRRIQGAERGTMPKAEFARQQIAAAGTIYHTLIAAFARSGALLKKIETDFGADVTSGFSPEFSLTGDEVSAVDVIRRRIVDDAKIAARNRDIERENATPGKRGRKAHKIGG